MRAALTTRPLDASKLIAEVSSPERGATACFIGSVRNSSDGREVEGIDYRAYEEMAEAEMKRILVEAMDQFKDVDIVAEHRTGQLDVSDASIIVVTAHAHRGPALDCLRYAVEEIKSRLTIWKLEHYKDGTREWVNAAPHAKVDRNAIA